MNKKEYENLLWKVIDKSTELLKESFEKDLIYVLLYGSTASGYIKYPSQEVDIEAMIKYPIDVNKIIKFKNLMKKLQKEYKKRIDLKFWSAGLGKVIEEQKIYSKKPQISFEFFFYTEENILSGRFYKISITKICEKIKKGYIKLLYGRYPLKTEEVKISKINKEDILFSSAHTIFPRMFSGFINTKKYEKLKNICNFLIYSSLFQLFEATTILIQNKTKLLKIVKQKFPKLYKKFEETHKKIEKEEEVVPAMVDYYKFLTNEKWEK